MYVIHKTFADMKNLYFVAGLLLLCSTLSSCGEKPSEPQPSDIITPAEKVYALSKFWQEVNYNFVFMPDVDRKMWDSAYLAYLDKALETKNDWEYYRLLQRFCALLNDGHTGISVAWSPLDAVEAPDPNIVFLADRHNLFEEGKFRLMEVDGKIYVEFVNKSLAPTIPAGSEVIKINGMPVEEYLAEYSAPYISQSAPHIRRKNTVSDALKGLYGERMSFSFIKPDGTPLDITLTFGGTDDRFPEGYEMMFPDEQGDWKLFDLKWHENDIARVTLNSFNSYKTVDLFKEKLPELRKAKGVIIDLRGNGGGNTAVGASILQYFTPDNKLYGSKSRTRQNIASYKAWGAFQPAEDTVGNEWAKNALDAYEGRSYYDHGQYTPEITIPLKDRIIVPTVVLIGNNTASAAEDFMILCDNQSHIVSIGEPTYGSTGQPLFFDLIKGISARVCTKDDTYPDGRKFIGVGVLPDIEVIPTLEERKAGRDIPMERAMEYLQSKI